MNTPSFAALFPDEDYGFRLTLRRGRLQEFYAQPADPLPRCLERSQWLIRDEARYFVPGEGCESAWAEFGAMVREWWQLPRVPLPIELATALDADTVLLLRDAQGRFRVRGGAVIFPTGWALADKIGLTLAETHSVVPGLNAAIGEAIDRFLERLKPGTSAERSNWGLAATDALNLHPALARPRLLADTPVERVWLRVEHQILTALPESGAVLFGIRIALHPLAEVLADETARRGLHRALASMPPAVAAYKGVAPLLSCLVEWTGQGRV